MNNNRRYLRIDVQGIEADISDDIGFCSAQVKDISQFGFCLSGLSRKLRVKGDKFMIIISGQGHRFKMYAQGRWEAEQGVDTKLGVEIRNVPWDWTQFVSDREPVSNDVWGPLGRY